MTNQPPVNDEDRADLVAYLDGELQGEAARLLEAKLSQDPRLRAEADSLRQAWELLDYVPRPEPSTDFTSRTLERVAALPPRTGAGHRIGSWRTWALGLSWAAAVFLAAVGGYEWMSASLQRPAPQLDEPADPDQYLVRDLRVIENKRLYDHVESLDFLRELDAPDLFGDDS